MTFLAQGAALYSLLVGGDTLSNTADVPTALKQLLLTPSETVQLSDKPWQATQTVEPIIQGDAPRDWSIYLMWALMGAAFRLWSVMAYALSKERDIQNAVEPTVR